MSYLLCVLFCLGGSIGNIVDEHMLPDTLQKTAAKKYCKKILQKNCCTQHAQQHSITPLP